MVASTVTKWVIAAPGRVAFTTAAAKEKFSEMRPKQVIWTPYLQELQAVHGDILIVDSPAQLLAKQQEEKKAASVKDAPKPEAAKPEAAKPAAAKSDGSVDASAKAAPKADAPKAATEAAPAARAPAAQ